MFQRDPLADVKARVERDRKRRDRAFNIVIITIALVPITGIAGMIYIAMHFLIKFW